MSSTRFSRSVNAAIDRADRAYTKWYKKPADTSLKHELRKAIRVLRSFRLPDTPTVEDQFAHRTAGVRADYYEDWIKFPRVKTHNKVTRFIPAGKKQIEIQRNKRELAALEGHVSNIVEMSKHLTDGMNDVEKRILEELSDATQD